MEEEKIEEKQKGEIRSAKGLSLDTEKKLKTNLTVRTLFKLNKFDCGKLCFYIFSSKSYPISDDRLHKAYSRKHNAKRHPCQFVKFRGMYLIPIREQDFHAYKFKFFGNKGIMKSGKFRGTYEAEEFSKGTDRNLSTFMRTLYDSSEGNQILLDDYFKEPSKKILTAGTPFKNEQDYYVVVMTVDTTDGE